MEKEEEKRWNISFAGCGFRSIYYLGALSCILDRVPHLVHGASRFCGASSGCLVAAALAVGIPMDDICGDLLNMAEEARKLPLSVFHPSFSLLRSVQRSLMDRLPEDAHLRASGRLYVSLTRLHDGNNVLVSQFDSREELIQVLMCSCFFPVYCGFVPPSYRGVLYMDGALSNNMPLFEHRNTITLAPFSGESDICPTEGTFNILEVHYGNVSIQVNEGNVHRVWTSFLPPTAETLAEICLNGYVDALRFLRQRHLIGAQSISSGLVSELEELKPTSSKSETELSNEVHVEDERLCEGVPERLPEDVKRVLCRSSRDPGSILGFRVFPLVSVLLFLIRVLTLPFELIVILIRSEMSSGVRTRSRDDVFNPGCGRPRWDDNRNLDLSVPSSRRKTTKLQ
ncbi:patatin-like phospholipase domain-containing protein 2 isoform X2 [Sphaeramia orbicularis]|uniref:patatin-like phospholipase domain-containing protein 2 isoform X2 n=1 Tax=Sphaeramia orbicularis TaxID=375764 RepID=UPI00117E5D28|nr:patatin-like phospholipase domain-containing protein 2 isoform X2 [Sphaeramia orbicularis]